MTESVADWKKARSAVSVGREARQQVTLSRDQSGRDVTGLWEWSASKSLLCLRVVEM